jgi:hypothetical protein
MSHGATRSMGALEIHPERLTGFGDLVILRDPAGRSIRPSLVPSRDPDAAGRLEAWKPFTIIQRYSIAPDEGARFARTMRDENPIHTKGDVVPGAMTASRFLLVPEMLLAGGRIERVKTRFRALTSYRHPTVNIFRIEPAAGGAKVYVSVRQGGAEVAEGQILVAGRQSEAPEASENAAFAQREAGLSAAPRGDEAARVSAFLEILRVDPLAYFRFAGPVYPRSYLAALPPGEMVRKFSGEGGLLNSLELEFHGEAFLGASSAPQVELVDGARPRKTFRKILARIAEGVRTFCSGVAMVLPKADTVPSPLGPPEGT